MLPITVGAARVRIALVGNGEAIQAWDKRLNEAYTRVMADLDPKSRELLRVSAAMGGVPRS